MAIEKLDKSELYGFPVTDLKTATAEETAGGITLPVIVVSNGVLTYKVVATKTWSDYVATTTADAISAANAKVDAATAKVDAAVQSANTAASNAQAAADNANNKAASIDSAVTKANKLSGDVSAMETRVSSVGTVVDNANNAATAANNAAKSANDAATACNQYVGKAQTAEEARANAETARVGAEKARTDAEIARASAETARADAESKRAAAEKTREISCAAAVAGANEVTANPTYVGKDNYVYRYDRTAKVYVKTEVYVKGDTGPQGPKGDTGEQGPKGDAGASLDVAAITWDTLKALRDSGGLQKGLRYRITDYRCTTLQTETRSAGHQFDIIVTALSSSMLSEKALAILHDGDTYFTNAKLQGWQLWYCLDNDITRFAWADNSNGKGVVYRMIDEFGNDCPYDFKNIQFKRYKISSVKNSNTKGLVGTYHGINNGPATVDSANFVWAYTFCGIAANTDEDPRQYEDGKVPSLDTQHSIDLSLNSGYATDPDGGGYAKPVDMACFNNRLRPHRVSQTVDDTTESHPQALADIVFLSIATVWTCNDTKRFEMSAFHDNSFGTDCTHISIGGKSYCNDFHGAVLYCIFNQDVQENTFGGLVLNNTFSGYVTDNTFSGNVINNTFSGYVTDNTFSGNVDSNTFSGNVDSNTFSGYVTDNTFSGNVTDNTFSGDVLYCSFEGKCSYCSFPGASGTAMQYLRQCGDTKGTPNARVTVSAKLGVNFEQVLTCDKDNNIVVKTPWN